MTFRWIEGEELKRLNPMIERYGWTPLNPHISKAIVAEDETGEIVGFNVLQLVARPEPMWIDKKYRGTQSVLASALAAKMINYLHEERCPYWEVKCDSPFVERLCIENQMEMIEVPVYAGGVPSEAF